VGWSTVILLKYFSLRINKDSSSKINKSDDVSVIETFDCGTFDSALTVGGSALSCFDHQPVILVTAFERIRNLLA